MEADNKSSAVAFDRRQLYRPFLERLNPIALPRDLLAHDLIVSRDHDPRDATQPPIHESLATSAELSRGIQIAVVGGIGSGKTTELALTHQLLKRHADAVNIYLDLANHTDLNGLSSGAILANMGIALYQRQRNTGSEPSEDARAAFQKLREIAFGTTKWMDPDGMDYDDDDQNPGLVRINVPGLMKLRFPALRREVNEVKELLQRIASPLLEAGAQITFLVDGLDRLIRADRFREYAEQDLRALRGTNITAIVAAPLLLWYDESRFIENYFDVVKHIPAAAPAESVFLVKILERRGAQELMDNKEITSVVKGSGGVLRDLLTLARSAAEYAYNNDQDRIGRQHVRTAIRQLGNRYLAGLGRTHRLRLRQLATGEGFEVRDSASRELLVNRQVLEHFSNGRESFVVHPALAKVLPKTA
ncbi:MAG: hypothetical protein WCB12_12610 [Bryobacteraceae bacterium]